MATGTSGRLLDGGVCVCARAWKDGRARACVCARTCVCVCGRRGVCVGGEGGERSSPVHGRYVQQQLVGAHTFRFGTMQV